MTKIGRAVFDLEDDIRRVEQWAEVLSALGAGGNDLSEDGIFVIGEALAGVGQSLRDQFRAMHAMVADTTEAPPCA